MNMKKVNDQGLSEGVVFAFYRDGQIMIEDRPSSDGAREKFFTNGTIEISDCDKGGVDYRKYALDREIKEEFSGKIIPKNILYLGELVVPEIKVLFFVYLITDWDDDMPDYTVEDGKKFSDLEWIPLKKASDYLVFDSALEICRRIKEVVS